MEGTMIAFLSLHISGMLGVKLCLDSFHWFRVHCGFCRCFPRPSGTSQCTSSPSRLFLKVKRIRQFASTMSFPPQVSILLLCLDRLPYGPDGCIAVTMNPLSTSVLAWVSCSPDPMRAPPLIESLIWVPVIFENCTMLSFFPSFPSFPLLPHFLSSSSPSPPAWGLCGWRTGKGSLTTSAFSLLSQAHPTKGPWRWSLVLRSTYQKAESPPSLSPLFLPIWFSLALDC